MSDSPETEDVLEGSDRRRCQSSHRGSSPLDGGHADAKNREGLRAPLTEIDNAAYCHDRGFVRGEDANDDELELERCLRDEMAAMDSGDDSTPRDEGDNCSRNGDGGTDVNELEDLLEATVNDGGRGVDVFPTPEWSQLMCSAEGVMKYMDGATAELLDASGLVVHGPHRQDNTRGKNTMAITERSQPTIVSSLGVDLLSNSDPVHPEMGTGSPALHLGLDCTGMDLAVPAVSPLGVLNTQQGEPQAENIDAPPKYTVGTASPLNGRDSCGRLATPRQSDVDLNTSTTQGGSRLVYKGPERAGHPVGLPTRPSTLCPSSPLEKPSRDVGEASHPDQTFSTTGCDAQDVRPLLEDEGLLAPAEFLECEMEPVSAQMEASHFLASVEDDAKLRTKTTELEVPWGMQSLEDDRRSARQQETALSNELREVFISMDGGAPAPETGGASIQITLVASVGEDEVARRIERDKARCVEARRQRREGELKRARLTRLAVVLQAAWRGRSARAEVAPARAARRRESEERLLMFQEQLLAAGVTLLEAERHEAERRSQVEELKTMRREEQRTWQAWANIARCEQLARGEEIARMRAEERYTRAFLDIELQESRLLDRARQEAAEAAEMRAEELASREFDRLERARLMERRAMEAEDVLARNWEDLEKRQLAVSQAEGCRMEAEDCECSAWNARCRREQELHRLRALATSTPIQRAMDPRGVAAAQRLARARPSWSDQLSVLPVNTGAEPELQPSVPLESGSQLEQERAQRRERYRGRLDGITAQALGVQRSREGTVRAKGKGAVQPNDGNHDARNGRQGGLWGGDSRLPPRKGEAGPAERDGEQCDLTVDMLSHLGPLQDLTGLELCVEGLTSASLLQACTSLKSLSLNVNRLSSPAGLAVSTTLVRLGLRDNRLSSLNGLSGLPNLRELRLDINHLTSLHELRSLPALVELSANTNHIRALPEGFAADLMSPTSQPVGPKNVLPGTVEPLAACGGLQKLELYHNRIASVHPRALEGLASLTHLDLGRNQLKTLDGRGLESCPALSTLVLSQNLLREPPFPLRLPLLSELWLSGNQLSGMGEWTSAPLTTLERPPVERGPNELPTAFEGTISENSRGMPAGPCVAPNNQDAVKGGVRWVSERGEGRRRTGLDGGDENGRGRNQVAAVGGGRGLGDASVWLPTLEVLHVQDNMLESLGGRWSLAGCPLLRSFDASFNHLRSPEGIGLCLRACRDLEEVRLHDNPASEYGNYADSIALSCPRLERLDGVALGVQAHWQAAANTYAGRADLVLPFLLQGAERRVTHAVRGAAAQNYPPSEGAEGNINGPEDPSEGPDEPECPWCWAGTPSAGNAVSGVSSATMGIRDYRRAGGVEDGDLQVGTPSHPGKLSQPNRSSAESGGTLRRNACASCGGVLPDADLWSANGSRAAHFSVGWNEVLSAGGRWRATFSAGAGVDDAGEDDLGKAADSSAFRRACLRGRDERASMRRRHRREERDLASAENSGEAGTRDTNGGGDGRARLAFMVPSKQRLEQELELGERHASERRDLAARQLRFHGSGTDHEDAHEDDGERVVLVMRPTAVETGQHDRVHVDIFKARYAPESPTRRPSLAAGVIQRLWRRRRERVEPEEGLPPRDVPRAVVKEPVNTRALTKLQSAFRGFHVRRALQAALDSARYVDDDLENLLSANGGDRFELDRFLSPPPELTDGWWGGHSASTPPRDGDARPRATPPSRARATSSRLIETARVVVGSAPLRSNAGVKQGQGLPNAVETSIVTGFDAIPGGRYDGESGNAHTSDGRGIEVDRGDVPDGGRVGGASPLEPSGTPAAVGLTNGYGTARRRSDGGSKARTNGDSQNGYRSGGDIGTGSPEKGAGNDLVEAWGLKDPRVARAMLKRTKRMRKFQTGEARRERLKNPDVRFEAFAKNAGDCRTPHLETTATAEPCPGVDAPSTDHNREAGSAGVGRIEGSRGEGPPMCGVRAASSKLGPIVVDAWARGGVGGNISAPSDPGTAKQRLERIGSPQVPRNTPSPSLLRLYHGTEAAGQTRGSHPPPTEERVAAHPPSMSPTVPARPWPPPKPHPRAGWGGSVGLPGPSFLSSSEARAGRPRARLCAHDLGAEAMLGGGDRVDERAGASSPGPLGPTPSGARRQAGRA